MSKAYLITGVPGVGKTTALKKVIEALGMEHCGGFYTEEMRIQGTRVGFRLVTLDGRQGIFAHVDVQSSIRVGRYGVNLNCLEEIGITALYAAMATKQLVVIDEIGPMELYSDRFKKAVLDVLQSSRPLLCTIALKSDPWLDALKRFAGVDLYTLTVDSRDTLVEVLSSVLTKNYNE